MVVTPVSVAVRTSPGLDVGTASKNYGLGRGIDTCLLLRALAFMHDCSPLATAVEYTKKLQRYKINVVCFSKSSCMGHYT